MNLQENIRRVLKESVPSQVRRRQEQFDRIFEHYRDSFKDHPYKTFESFWNLLMESSFETLYHAWFSKTVSDDDWEESAEYIEKYLIKKYYDDTKQMWEKKHRNRINESKDKNIEKNLRLIRKLLETIDIDGLCKIWVEYNPEDGDYEIRSTTTNRYYDLADMTEELDYIDDTIRSWKLKPYIFTPNYVENCEDEVEFMNESTKQTNYIKIAKELVEPYKQKDCICDIKVSFDVEDNYYNVYLVFSQEELHDKFSDVYGIRSWITKMIRDVTIELGAFLPIPNIYVGKYLKPNCQWSPLNESKQERKFTKLLNNIEEYLNSNSYDSVVRFMVDYDEVMDDVIVNIFFDPEKAHKLGGGINSVIKKTGKKIMEDLSVFPFDFKYHIHFEKPKLNESRTNSSLNNLLNLLFDGFDDIYYDWANYMCGMGECCDPYAIGFTLPKNHYDDYIFKLVDSVKYDDDGDYPKELRDELPEVCYESPDIKNPDFDTIVFYGLYAEEIEDYMGPESNWKSDLLKIINKKFGCEAKQIIII